MNPSTDPPRDQGGDADARAQNPSDADREADPGDTIDAATGGTSGSPPADTRPPSAHVADQAAGRIPAELRAIPRWVVWRWEWRRAKGKGEGKWTKPPIDPQTGMATDATDEAAWMSFDDARRLSHELGDGIGWACGPIDPADTTPRLNGVDLDHVIDASGKVEDWAQAVVQRLNSYTERTPSGTGLRTWAWGRLPRNAEGKSRHRTKDHPGLEFYENDRFFTVTGDHWPGTPTTIEDRATELAELHAEIFAPKEGGRPGSKRPEPFDLDLDLDDDALIAKARAARNGPKFAALFDQGDTSGYGGDDSAADFALCAILGFWTGDDPGRVERIFDRSALGRRDKWKDRADYRATTIRNALDGIREFYKPPATPAMKPAGPQTRPSGQPSSNGHAATVLATGGGGGGGGGASGGGGGGAGLDDELAGWTRTDYGNAERLVARYGRDLRHVGRWGKFYAWDGRRWKLDYSGLAERLAKLTVRAIYKEAATIVDDKERRAHVRFALASEGRSRIAAMLALAATEASVAVEHDIFDTDPWLLNVPNGTIDLRDGSLNPHRREDLLTTLAPVAYDRDAECPLWDGTLELIFGGDKDLIAYFRRLCGVCLTGTVTEQFLPIFHGEGNNGKSTILGCLMDILGEDLAMKAKCSFLMARRHPEHLTEMASLLGKRLVVAIETGERQRIDETLVKELTGSDPIRARRMREDEWQFKPTHKIILGTNHEPVIVGTDYAIWRRINKIPFGVIIPPEKVDKDMPAKLRAEYPGILAWAVRGCLEWQRNGLDTPKSVLAATETYKKEQDVIGRFVAEECHVGDGLKSKASAIYARYKVWAAREGEEVISQTAFGRQFGKRFQRTKEKDKWYHGIMLRPDGGDPDADS